MMRNILAALFSTVLGVSTAYAQGQQTGTLQGAVTDADRLALPGVTIVARSSSLQGTRETVTGGAGEFVLRGLPPGTYEVAFSLTGFADGRETVTVALGLPTDVSATMAPAGVSEQVDVIAETSSVLVSPAASANYDAVEVDTLATGRTLSAIAELAPGLTANTPNADQVAISGAFAYDNVFLVDGVDINDNLFGSPDDLFIEEAIEQTQVLTSGVSAEYGRFSGGVINAISKSGGNLFSGSFRTDLTNPPWRDETPFEQKSETTRPDDPRRSDRSPPGCRSPTRRQHFFLAMASTTSAQAVYFGRRGSELFPHGAHLFDLALTYSLPVLRTLRPYLKVDVRNLFNSTPLLSHDTTLTAYEDGPVDALGLPTTFERGPGFGEATSNNDYPFPREVCISFGFRF